VKCASWGIVTANSFPVDSGIERVRGEEHAKALVEFGVPGELCASEERKKLA
jgi:hypothetical protein